MFTLLATALNFDTIFDLMHVTVEHSPSQHGGFLKCCTGVQDTSRNGNFSTKEQIIG